MTAVNVHGDLEGGKRAIERVFLNNIRSASADPGVFMFRWFEEPGTWKLDVQKGPWLRRIRFLEKDLEACGASADVSAQSRSAIKDLAAWFMRKRLW